MGEKSGKNNEKEKFTLFFGAESPFSQFHPAQFTIDDVTYSCAEQYMMHQKAVVFKDPMMAEEIMKATEPRKMKAFGRKVSNFDPAVWGKKSLEVVRKGNIAKFGQNPVLKEQLFNTKGTTLVEASPRDRLWGIGLGQKNPKALDRKNWRGKNLLGQILTEVRLQLMEEDEGEPAASVSAQRDLTLFSGSDSPFSQSYMSDFTVDGVTYSSGEQFIAHQKALLFNNESIAEKILEETRPHKVARISNKIKNVDPDVWLKKCQSIALKGNKAKFSQNKKLKEALMQTKSSLLAEASRDEVFGIGMEEDDPDANQEKKWRGRNILGQVLVKVREAMSQSE